MKLAAWRKRNGHTQEALAELLGCSQPYVSQIERTKSSLVPGPSMMVEIYALTNGEVQPNDFYELPKLQPRRAAA